ncbi:MAG: type II toxin-antitoxin system VapC family toxin [Crocosphaera sp.]
MILCDTNIIIEFYKNQPLVISQLRNIGSRNLAISVITEAKLYYGALNKQELNKISNNLKQLHILPIDKAISTQFIKLMQKYTLSHKLTIPDALIAATVIVHKIELYKLNKKDFAFIESLNLYS